MAINYFYFESLGNGNTVKMLKEGNPPMTPTLFYSTDTQNWYLWDRNNITVNNGEKLYLRGDNNGFADYGEFNYFSTNGYFKVGGDIRSLMNIEASGNTISVDYCFWGLFNNCTGITEVSEGLLSGYTTLGYQCYIAMFNGCTSLTNAPALPAMSLEGSCYAFMFQGCTSLTQAPTLPATTLADSCYQGMFNNCTSLNYIKCLATIIPSNTCTNGWTRNVSSTGTFVKDEHMTSWVSGNHGIPVNWTVKNNGDDEMKIQFRKKGEANWVDNYPTYLPIEASGGSVFYNVKYTYETSNYTTGHYSIPTGWSIVDGGSTQGSGYEIKQYTINYPPSTGSTPESALITFFLSDNGETITNSIPLSADTIYTSYLYVGDESGSTITTMEAAWEGEYDSDFHTYYWQENIDSIAFSADVDWITNIWIDGDDEEIGCYVEPNYGLAPRTGTITVVGTDTIGRTHTCTIVINQDWNVRYPIWQDVYFTGATDTLDYYIAMDTGSATRDIIYQGRAYLQPSQNNVKINISKICQNYLSNNIEDGNSIRNLNNININSMKHFYIFNASGDTQLMACTYVYDWSYGNLSADGILTNPINGHADSRMIKLGTSVEPSLYYRNHSIPSIYTSGYCGDYAIYYLQRNGGWAAFLIEGNSKKSDSYQKYSYNMAYNNTTAQFEECTYHNEITSKWQMSTGWLTDEQSQNLAFNLIPSNRVFLHDLKADKIIPVIVSNNSVDYKTFKNTGRRLVRYDITLTESQKKQML